MRLAAVVLLALLGCRDRTKAVQVPDDAAAAAAGDAATAVSPVGEASRWPELAELPVIEPVTVIELPVARGVPLASVVGPVAFGDLAVIGSSQIGFAAIDWRDGRVAWRRAAGSHLAPPVAHRDGVLLVGECERATIPPSDHVIVGCWRVMSPIGHDLAAGSFAGDAAAVAAFVGARGVEALLPIDDHRLTWIRGDAAVEIDLETDRATPVTHTAVAAIARHKGREWRIAIEPDQALVGRDPAGVEQWRMTTRFAAVIGVVPGQAYEVPMVRVVNLKGASGRGFVDLIDIDATGSRLGQAGALVPGIAVIGHAFAAPGDTALAVRLDTTLEHDYVAAHDARGGLAWVWPLPLRPRADPVGLAFTDDGSVLVFHDGDHLTVLPAVSRRSTRGDAVSGSGSGSSENPTP